MKGADVARRVTHAQPNIRREPGGANLAGAERDGIEQSGLPARWLGGARSMRARLRGDREQLRHALQRGGGQCRQPLPVKLGWQHQCEQFAGVGGFGRGGQQLLVQAVHQLADEGIARGKAVVGQQGGAVHRVGKLAPPRLPARAGAVLFGQRVEQQFDPCDGRFARASVAANPVKQGNQPQVALDQLVGGVQVSQQRREFSRIVAVGAHQCRVRDPPEPW